ncbi:phage minor capsid protein [Corynebacterium striatum]
MVDSKDWQAARLVRVYEDAELLVLQELAKAIKSGTYKDVNRLLHRDAELKKLIARARRILNAAGHKTDAAITELALAEYDTAVNEVLEEVGAASSTIAHTPAVTVVQAAAASTATRISGTHLQVIRDVSDVYRSITSQTVQAAITAGIDHQAAMRHALNQYADRGVTSLVDRAGRRWAMDSYVDMSIRTMRNQATQEGHLTGYERAGVELVRASWHTASAPQCFPFQNQLLAISGGAGPRTLVDPATGDKVTVTVKDTLRGAISKGYHHVNCRHRDVAYTPGDKAPTVPQETPAENKKKYKATQKQRDMERQLRRWKRREAVALSPLDKSTAKAKITEWNNRIENHVNSHDYLTRWSHRERPRD